MVKVFKRSRYFKKTLISSPLTEMCKINCTNVLPLLNTTGQFAIKRKDCDSSFNLYLLEIPISPEDKHTSCIFIIDFIQSGT